MSDERNIIRFPGQTEGADADDRGEVALSGATYNRVTNDDPHFPNRWRRGSLDRSLQHTLITKAVLPAFRRLWRARVKTYLCVASSEEVEAAFAAGCVEELDYAVEFRDSPDRGTSKMAAKGLYDGITRLIGQRRHSRMFELEEISHEVHNVSYTKEDLERLETPPQLLTFEPWEGQTVSVGVRVHALTESWKERQKHWRAVPRPRPDEEPAVPAQRH